MSTAYHDCYRYVAGKLPLLISVPHDGRALPKDVAARMTPTGRAIPDTDWDVARLYAFAEDMGAHMLTARYSRYVVDLNRPDSDEALYPGQLDTGLCPQDTFAGEPIYTSYTVDAAERRRRVDAYWAPYHEKIAATLDAIKQQFGYALLWDAHSIESSLPRLFAGTLPLLNLGSNNGQSCATSITKAVAADMQEHEPSSVVDGRFKGGYITRYYGQPDKRIHALQLEISQRAYRDESAGRYDESKAQSLRVTLRIMLDRLLHEAK